MCFFGTEQLQDQVRKKTYIYNLYHYNGMEMRCISWQDKNWYKLCGEQFWHNSEIVYNVKNGPNGDIYVVVISTDCQPYRIQNPLRDKPPGTCEGSSRIG